MDFYGGAGTVKVLRPYASILRCGSEAERRERLVELMKRTLTCGGVKPRAMANVLRNYEVPDCPYAVAAEWEFQPGYSNLGRGDLLFASSLDVFQSGHAPALVCGVKVQVLQLSSMFGSAKTARTSRTKKRGKVIDLAQKTARTIRLLFPGDGVISYGVVFSGDGSGIADYWLPVLGDGGWEGAEMRSPSLKGDRFLADQRRAAPDDDGGGGAAAAGTAVETDDVETYQEDEWESSEGDDDEEEGTDDEGSSSEDDDEEEGTDDEGSSSEDDGGRAEGVGGEEEVAPLLRAFGGQRGLGNRKLFVKSVFSSSAVEVLRPYASILRCGSEAERRERLVELMQQNATCGGQEMRVMANILLTYESPQCPYAVAAEWDFQPGYSNYGRGDLLFASSLDVFQSGHAPALVCGVEVKVLQQWSVSGSGKTTRTSRTKKRRKVEQQSWTVYNTLHNLFRRDAVVTFAVIAHGNSLHPSEWLPYYGPGPSSRRDLSDVRFQRTAFLADAMSEAVEEQGGGGGKAAAKVAEWEEEEDDDEGDERQVVLQMELVPSSLWAREYKPKIALDLWHGLLDFECERAGHRCECCGVSGVAAHPERVRNAAGQQLLVIHQHWDVAMEERELEFRWFEVLCWRCHDVKHLGWASCEGRSDDALSHLQRQWMQRSASSSSTVSSSHRHEDVLSYVDTEFRSYAAANEALQRTGVRQWHVDMDSFHAHPFVQQWLAADDAHIIERFGSLCLKRSGYQLQPEKAPGFQ